MQRFEVLESELTDSDTESIKSDIDSPVISRDKSPSSKDFYVKKIQVSQSELSDSDDSVVFEAEEPEPNSQC